MFVQINLISHQLIPNAIPTLAWRNNTVKVFLIVAGSTFNQSSQQLVKFYNKNGIKDVEVIKTESPNDFHELRKLATKLFDRIKVEFPNDEIVFNATGGTKPMSLAFYRQFDQPNEKSLAIYVDTDANRIIFLNDNEDLTKLKFDSVLDIDSYLELKEAQIESLIDESSADHHDILERKALTLALCKFSNLNGVIPALNGICADSQFNNTHSTQTANKPSKFIPTVKNKSTNFQHLNDLLELLEEHEILAINGSDITFSSEEKAAYCGGGWMEELAYIAAHDAGIEHIAMSVEIKINNNKVLQRTAPTNEIDLILVNNNHILFGEAKTSQWNDGSGQNIVWKSQGISDYFGGPFAEGVLISALPFNDSTRTRAKLLTNTSPFHVQSYKALVNRFIEWKEKTERHIV